MLLISALDLHGKVDFGVFLSVDRTFHGYCYFVYSTIFNTSPARQKKLTHLLISRRLPVLLGFVAHVFKYDAYS